MTDFFFARSQMATSLAFHIVFAALGMGMPLLMAIAEGLYLRTHDRQYLELSKRWAKGTAILFAVGAVSGTVLSFELGLLWPKFMEFAGAIIGMPFSLEGFAFFTEAIFLGVFMYGWKRLSPFVHWLSGVLVAVSGVFSGIFVVTANAWMNAPAGFAIVNGAVRDIDPVAAMFNRASVHEVLHMTLAAFVASGFAVAAVHAWFVLRKRNAPLHRRGLGIALGVACVCAPLQFVSGDISARAVAQLQPAKLAAMEAHYHSRNGAPRVIGGFPDDDAGATALGIEIPRGLSLLAAHDPDAHITGLDQFPRADWPDVRVVHWSFDVMVGIGSLLLALSIVVGWRWWRDRRVPDRDWLMKVIIMCGPLGFLALEAGWMVTEVGRQPWVVYNIVRTADAVTPMTGMVVPFVGFTVLYVFLAIIVGLLLRRQFVATMIAGDIDTEEPHA